jgi:hypothetical protein
MRTTLKVIILVAGFYLTALAVQTGLIVLGLASNGLDQPAARQHRAELVQRISLVARAARVWAELPGKPSGC